MTHKISEEPEHPEEADVIVGQPSDANNTEPITTVEDESLITPPSAPPHIQKRHPAEQIIGNINDGLRTRGKYIPGQYAYVSQFEPKNYKEALKNDDWFFAMVDELSQFKTLHVWDLVPRPLNQSVIGTKWILRNKYDEEGVITRNKARLVAQGYTQEEGVDYDETFAPVARLESIRLLCAYSYMGFPLFKWTSKVIF
ncbi:unnamed protein product [Linum trigynum]|uniref:Reverse transcriptase Ty1/copia-type domain-containing protein n=1 Tax=Linum trigynum TaxID=586398 RepID=A0AAV2FB42_9ROSI